MTLLWGKSTSPTRGPKPGLTVPAIVSQAISLADKNGLDGLSMRAVAEALGCSAMSLYTYVQDKAELLDLMVDHVLGELDTQPGTGPWKTRVRTFALSLRDHLLLHPWMLQVGKARALLGPNEIGLYEAQLQLFEGIGLSGPEMMRAVSSLSQFIYGSARFMADARMAQSVTGVTDDEWWHERSALLTEMAGDLSQRFPLIRRLEEEQAFDLHDSPYAGEPYTLQEARMAFDFGLNRMLDGIESHVKQRRRSKRPSRGSKKATSRKRRP